jgi:hypothetical protein
MLGRSGAGIDLSALSTGVLVDVVHRASKDQIKAIGEHAELRCVFLDEIFQRMSDHFVPERAKNIDMVVSWRFTTSDGEDGFDRFQTVISPGPRTPPSRWQWRTSSGWRRAAWPSRRCS